MSWNSGGLKLSALQRSEYTNFSLNFNHQAYSRHSYSNEIKLPKMPVPSNSFNLQVEQPFRNNEANLPHLRLREGLQQRRTIPPPREKPTCKHNHQNAAGSWRWQEKATSRTCPIEIALEAVSRRGTLLYTDDERTYWSTRFKHAEEVFIRETKHQDISNIKEIRIKNSPCSWCADKLIEHFAFQPDKPTMYIGKIWNGAHGNRWTNREGLRRMKRNGFHLRVWYAGDIFDSLDTENDLKTL